MYLGPKGRPGVCPGHSSFALLEVSSVHAASPLSGRAVRCNLLRYRLLNRGVRG